MSVPLRRLLESVLENEPALGDEVDAVFRAADRLRRRRTRALVWSGLIAAAGIVAAGCLLTTTLLPTGGGTTPHAAPTSAAPPSTDADRVLAVVTSVVDGKGTHIYPRPPERGNGWRQYSVVDRDGKPRGTLDVAVYASPEDLCFPVPSAPGTCSPTEWAPRGIEYVRYDDEQDPDRQVHQTIARRISDGRVVSVMADGQGGKPGLTGKQVEKIATDPRLGDAFGPQERCPGPSACPAFTVPVPVAAG
jgi:hypothetical protein